MFGSVIHVIHHMVDNYNNIDDTNKDANNEKDNNYDDD